MKRLFLFLVVLFFCSGKLPAANATENPALIEAIKKYYEIVDKAKLSYENELRKVLANTQKAGNVKAYNAIEAELDHTIEKDGHSITEFTPPQRSTLYSKKAALKRTVDAARKEFKAYAEKLASDLMKDGQISDARTIDLLANAVEPPRFYIEKENPAPAKMKNDELEEPWYRKMVEMKLRKLPAAKLKILLGENNATLMEFGCFSPDSKKFLGSVSFAGQAWLFDVKTGKQEQTLHAGERIGGGGIFPDGKTAVCGTASGKIVYWNLEDGTVLRTYQAHQGHVDRITISIDGTMLASFSNDKTAAIWNTATDKELHRLTDHTEPVCAGRFSPDGKILATAAHDGKIIIWNINTGKAVQTLAGHQNNAILGLAFHPKGTVLASGGYDQQIILWNIKTGKTISFPMKQDAAVVDLDFSPDGTQLVAGCDPPQKSTVWNVGNGMPLYRLNSPNEACRNLSARFSPDGTMVTTCGRTPQPVWNVPSQK